MQTLTLRIDDAIYSNVLWFLNQLPTNKIEIEAEANTAEFVAYKKFLKKEIEEIDSGKAKFFTTEQVENRLNNVIERHENRI